MPDPISNNPYAAPNAALSEPITADGFYQPKVFSLNGRIGRLRYLAYTWVLTIGVGIIATMLVGALAKSAPAVISSGGSYIVAFNYILFSIPGLFMARRRFHDLDHSGWLCLLILVPIVNFLAGLYLIFGPGNEGANRYGPPPSKNPLLAMIGGVILPLIVIIGILAAVAIPAYQTYTQRAIAAKHVHDI